MSHDLEIGVNVHDDDFHDDFRVEGEISNPGYYEVVVSITQQHSLLLFQDRENPVSTADQRVRYGTVCSFQTPEHAPETRQTS